MSLTMHIKRQQETNIINIRAKQQPKENHLIHLIKTK